MRQGNDLLDGIDRAQRIRNVGDGNKFRLRAEQFYKFLEDQLTPIIDGNDAEGGAYLFRQQLPRHDVGMVFQFADDDFVARANVCLLYTSHVAVHGSRPVQGQLGSAGFVTGMEEESDERV